MDLGNTLSHHAYAISAGRSDLDAVVAKSADIFGVDPAGNADVIPLEREFFGMEEARELKRLASMRPVLGRGLYIFYAFDSISLEAQNALLKLLEEPADGVRIFLITPKVDILLPTVLSRMELLDAGLETNRTYCGNTADEFLPLGPTARTELLKGIIESGDKSEALAFLDGLEKRLRAGCEMKHAGAKILQDFEAVSRARAILLGKGPSVKRVMEYVAVTVGTPAHNTAVI